VVLKKINFVDFFGIKSFMSIFPKQNHVVGFGMLEKILIFRGQEIIDHFWKFLRRVNL
jgi:hypothetical protein